MKPIKEVAHELGLDRDDVVLWGANKAKIALSAIERSRAQGRLVLVSAMTPTPAGEGKTTTAIGLAQGLAKTGHSACVVLREPSLGPTFGRKGGATGGGRSALRPADDINLHFTGDLHAIASAHNMLAALLDNHLHQGNRLGIDLRRVLWRRVLDINDRSLRDVVIGLGGIANGPPRQTGFDITAASEVMAALCLATDHDDLRRRLTKMIVAFTTEGAPVTAGNLNAVGAMLVLLKDALSPNLVQTTEGVPAIVHGGPFANIAHGCNSVVATRLGISHADWVVTEAGFGFDLGGEKFFDLKCVSAGLDPAAVVLVATIRALKHHGGVERTALGRPDAASVEVGLGNLFKHVESVRRFGRLPIVTVNRFDTDRDDEIRVVQKACERDDLPFAVCDGFTRGGDGATTLAETVVQHGSAATAPFTPLYDRTASPKDKLTAIASTMYGAASVTWERQAEKDLTMARSCGGDHLPLCVAKTHASLSDDATRIGRPENFPITVRRIILAAGAGYLVPVLGQIRRMPGLPASPQAERMDLIGEQTVGVSS